MHGFDSRRLHPPNPLRALDGSIPAAARGLDCAEVAAAYVVLRSSKIGDNCQLLQGIDPGE